jgi:hypothetical protein
MHPCILNPKVFNLSWPSMCHIWLAQALLRSLLLLLLSMPRGSNFTKHFRITLGHYNLVIMCFHIFRYPTLHLLPDSLCSTIRSISSCETCSSAGIHLRRPRLCSLLLRVDELNSIPCSFRNSSISTFVKPC